MTRFARAKGSKASNERVPDEPTPWHIMKQQLEDSISSKSPPEKCKTAKELLRERDEPYYGALAPPSHDWAEFEPETPKNPSKAPQSLPKNSKRKSLSGVENAPNATPKKSRKRASTAEIPETSPVDLNNSPPKTPKIKKQKTSDKPEATEKSKNENSTLNYSPSIEKLENSELTPSKSVNASASSAKKNKSKTPKKYTLKEDSENSKNSELSTELQKSPEKNELNSQKAKKLKTPKKPETAGRDVEKNSSTPPQPLESPEKNSQKIGNPKKTPKKSETLKEDSQNPEIANFKNSASSGRDEKISEDDKSSVKLSKRQKRNRKNKLKQSEEEISKIGEGKLSEGFDTEGNDWSSEIKQESSSKARSESVRLPEDAGSAPDLRRDERSKLKGKFEGQKVMKKQKPGKVRDDKEHKRRKPVPGCTRVIINGMEIEIVMYDGFPVKKEDAERLIELRKQMVMKGIPKSEINAAMKLERRKAEKALTRVKKNVCFHCRKAGHNLSDCPDLGREEAATGICFKCGSTEHTHFECRVTKKEEFGFAKCFICREQGHIAKQCPDNPKGLYPQGGSCKICGDVTHLKKDCPDLVKDKEDNTVTLGTIAEDNLESLGRDKIAKEKKTIKQKIVTF